jgi:hypothetical protein
MEAPVARMAITIPKIGVIEKTIIVLTVPIFLSPLRKNNRAYPNPKTDMKIIWGHKITGNSREARPNSMDAPNKMEPPKKDFIIASGAGSILDVTRKRRLMLLSRAQQTVAASIIMFPSLN